MSSWIKLFTPADLGFLTSLSIVTFALRRATIVSDRLALVAPMIVGLAWGVWSAMDTGGYAFTSNVFAKGMLLAAGSVVIGQLADSLLPRRAPTP